MHMSSQAQVTQNPSMGLAGEHELSPITEVISSKLGHHGIGVGASEFKWRWGWGMKIFKIHSMKISKP